MNKRDTVLALLAFGAAPLAAEAQHTGKIHRIGILTLGFGPATPEIETFRDALRAHGYLEGQGIALEYRFAQGKLDRLAVLAAELVRLPVDIIVTESTPAAQAAKRATVLLRVDRVIQ